MPRFPWSLVPSSGEGSNRYRRRTVLFEDLLGNGARGVPKLLPWRVRRELSIGHEHLDSAARDSLQAAGNLRTFALPVVFPAATCTLPSRSRIIGEYAPRTNRARRPPERKTVLNRWVRLLRHRLGECASMRRIELEQYIAAPPSRIWPVLSEHEAM